MDYAIISTHTLQIDTQSFEHHHVGMFALVKQVPVL